MNVFERWTKYIIAILNIAACAYAAGARGLKGLKMAQSGGRFGVESQFRRLFLITAAAHAVFDVVVDDEVGFFVVETEFLCKLFINVIHF